MELGAAELLSKLYTSVKSAMGLQNVQYLLWSDSSIALRTEKKGGKEIYIFQDIYFISKNQCTVIVFLYEIDKNSKLITGMKNKRDMSISKFHCLNIIKTIRK